MSSCSEGWAAKRLTVRDPMIVGAEALLDGRAYNTAAQGKASRLQCRDGMEWSTELPPPGSGLGRTPHVVMELSMA